MKMVLVTSLVAGLFCSVGRADYWTEPMQDVHANFTGEPGTISRFGDSIFISQAFFTPLRMDHQNVSPDTQSALDWIRGYLPTEVWSWQSPETGASGGKTSAWPLESDQNPPRRNIDHWLDTLNPEMAIIMWGTNDLQLTGSVDTYVANMRDVVRTVKANGTIPILTSIPPRHGYDVASQEHAQAIAELALEESVPLIDYHQEIRDRGPGDTWDGSLVYSGEGSVYQVERLVSGDGIHPSNPSAYRKNFSEEALSKSGFTLLNYLALHATYDVYQQVIDPDSGALAGDYNDNGLVDAADYTVWRDALGSSMIIPNDPTPEMVMQEDFDVWKANFGATADSSSNSLSNANVPEPTSWAIIVAMLAGFCNRRKAW